MSARLEPGDCRHVMLEMAAAGEVFDSIVTDPPYDLTSVVRRFGSPTAAPAQHGRDGLYARQSRGFMGKHWDGTGIAFDPATWRLAYDVLKPGAHLLAFGGTRTFHRMAVAIEDAGFEIRDCIVWLYGSGFPKSHDVAKGIDREGGESAAWQGWGTALKPGWEPVIVARKPLIGTVAANVLAHGTGALNIDGSRIGTDIVGWGGDAGGGNTWDSTNCGLAKSGAARPVEGRWPANVIHDGSPEVEAAFASFGERPGAVSNGRKQTKSVHTYEGGWGTQSQKPGRGDSGTASRFFYNAKAGAADRAGSKHPTVKPLALMRYLINLVTPPGGTVLDPFAGSGTTLQAARDAGFNAVGIEREPEYQADIMRRLADVASDAEREAAELAELCA